MALIGGRGGKNGGGLALRAGLVVMGVGVGLLISLIIQTRSEARPGVEAAPEAAVWRLAPMRHFSFDVDSPRFRPLGLEALALRRADGAQREVFAFGTATGDTRHAKIVVDRGEVSLIGFGEEIAALAREFATPIRFGAGDGMLDTKFGALPTVDLAIDGEFGPKACLGFGFRDLQARVRVMGWVCSRGAELVDRRDAVCLIDRLVTIGPGDTALAALFARAELSRNACGPQSGAQTDQGRLTLRGGLQVTSR